MLSTNFTNNQNPPTPFLFSSFELDYKYLFLTKTAKPNYYFISDIFANQQARLQYNKANKFLQYIIIDCDNNEYKKILKLSNSPKPNYIISNKEKAGAHLFFILERPILKNQYFQYFADRFFYIFKELTRLYKGDNLAKGYIGKNYLNTTDFDHEIIQISLYSLEDLEQFTGRNETFTKKTEKEKPTYSNIEVKNIEEGQRNIFIFNELRKYAYIVKNSKNLQELLQVHADTINEKIQKPLPQSEINATVKSVFKYFSSNKYKEQKKKRGKMALNDDLTLKEKQKLGAEYSAKVKNAKTEMRIKTAVLEMRKKGLKITNYSVAKFSKISKPTIAKYSDLLK